MPYEPLDIEDVMPFGKHKGETIEQIIDNDPEYLGWLLTTDKPPEFTIEVLEILMRMRY